MLVYCINCERIVTCDYKNQSCHTCPFETDLNCKGIKKWNKKWNKDIDYTICRICFLNLRWEIFKKKEVKNVQDI